MSGVWCRVYRIRGGGSSRVLCFPLVFLVSSPSPIMALAISALACVLFRLVLSFMRCSSTMGVRAGPVICVALLKYDLVPCIR